MAQTLSGEGTPGGRTAVAGATYIDKLTGIIYMQTSPPFGSSWSILNRADTSETITAIDTFSVAPIFNAGATFNTVSPTFTVAPIVNAVPAFNSGATFSNTAPVFSVASTFNGVPSFNSGATFSNTIPTFNVAPILNSGATFSNHLTELSGTNSFTSHNQITSLWIEPITINPFDTYNITIVNNLVYSASSACFASVGDYGGNGTPIVRSTNTSNGDVTVRIYNAHSANTVDGDFRLSVMVF